MSTLSRRSVRALVVSSLVGLVVSATALTASATDSSSGIACRTHSASDGTSELVLHWEGTSAKGTLNHTAPSGNVTTHTVRAQRQDGLIIADDVFEQDLVSHAAVIRADHGKRYMRTETNTWLACE